MFLFLTICVSVVFLTMDLCFLTSVVGSIATDQPVCKTISALMKKQTHIVMEQTGKYLTDFILCWHLGNTV